MVEKYAGFPGIVGYSFTPDEAAIMAAKSWAIQALLTLKGVQEPTRGFDITVLVDADHTNEQLIERVIEDAGLTITAREKEK